MESWLCNEISDTWPCVFPEPIWDPGQWRVCPPERPPYHSVWVSQSGVRSVIRVFCLSAQLLLQTILLCIPGHRQLLRLKRVRPPLYDKLYEYMYSRTSALGLPQKYGGSRGSTTFDLYWSMNGYKAETVTCESKDHTRITVKIFAMNGLA